jgi:REP element-mobilizing transposase RayT
VICRGIERRKIFHSDSDRRRFLERLGRLVRETSAGLSAWALMPNHAHVLLRTGKLPLSALAVRSSSLRVNAVTGRAMISHVADH